MTNSIHTIIWILGALSTFIGFFYAFRSIYVIAGAFWTRKFPKAKNFHKYAILIAARNEETVLGNLIDSIRQQDYPQELIDIFVVADNCTDHTAQVARDRGAYCYERQDQEHRTKGFALQYLVDQIRDEFGIDAYEGYFIFDADNLLKKDFVRHMNDSFDAGEKIVTSFRNTKNFDDNWISASYGIHWLRSARTEHRARSLFRLATRIQGTGFLFAWEIIRDGWTYTSLTEDRAFCADSVANGYKISYNDKAEFYDEQPIDIRIALRQRLRWAKGHLQAFTETGGKLLKHIFYTGGAANRNVPADTPRWRKFINNIRLRYMSLDMLTIVFPLSLFHSIRRVLLYILRSILFFTVGLYISTTEWGPQVFKTLFGWIGFEISAEYGVPALALMFFAAFLGIINNFLKNGITAAYVLFMERKRIMCMKWYKKVWFCITFPLFDYIGRFATIFALFMKIEWKPIPHKRDVSIETLTPCGSEEKAVKQEPFAHR